jgi:hypothetical protein
MALPRRFLLTGAGFSKNFGGPLATEVWAKIFNHHSVQQSERLRSLLLDNFDYEEVYHRVITGEYFPSDRNAMIGAVDEAYKAIDEALRDFSWGRNGAFFVDMYGIQEFIAGFAGSRREPGYFFNLNQDLFLERHYYNGPRPNLPGIPHRQEWFTSHFRQPLAPEDFIAPPEGDDFKSIVETGLPNSGFYYIKLHGSQNWRFASGGSAIVIGHGKEEQIQHHPLLAWYFDVFCRTLAIENARLMIVGYGFRDAHVNRAIADAIGSSGLSVHILSPQSPSDFRKMLESQERGKTIWGGLGGYYQYTLDELFPGDQSETASWRGMVTDFFCDALQWPGAGY